MSCIRCCGLLVTEPRGGLDVKGHGMPPAVRCVNCGYIDDPVFHANRLNLQAVRVLDGDIGPFFALPPKEHPFMQRRKTER